LAYLPAAESQAVARIHWWEAVHLDSSAAAQLELQTAAAQLAGTMSQVQRQKF